MMTMNTWVMDRLDAYTGPICHHMERHGIQGDFNQTDTYEFPARIFAIAWIRAV